MELRGSSKSIPTTGTAAPTLAEPGCLRVTMILPAGCFIVASGS